MNGLVFDSTASGPTCKLRSLVLLLWLVAAALPSFASRTVTDETGRTVSVPDYPHRIICLVPSITDDVFSLGAAEDVVAVSDYVKYPAEARSKTSVGSITNPSIETIISLHPDLVLGMPHVNQQTALDQILRLGVPVFLVDPHGIAGILRSIVSLGQATHREVQATALVSHLQQRIAAVHDRVRDKRTISIFMPVSFDPIITIGNGAFITEIIATAGGRSITDDLGQEWPYMSMEAVVARAPEALLLTRGGRMSVDSLKDRPGWNVLPAVRAGRVYFVDQRVELPSPVAIDALEDLARQFHP